MSAVWVLALGASLGYLAFKRHAIASRLDLAVAEYDSGSKASESDGVTFGEIKERWRYTEDTRQKDFHERLPAAERQRIMAVEDAAKQEVTAFDQTEPPVQIVGVYLE